MSTNTLRPVRWSVQAIVFAGILVLCGLLYGRISRREPLRLTSVGEGVRIVEVRSLEAGPFAAPLVGYGTAKAAVTHSIRPEVPGRVERVSPSFAEGRNVREGELLFELQKKDVSIAILESEAQLQQATAALAEVESQFQPISIEYRRLEQELVDLSESTRVMQAATELARAEVGRLERLGPGNVSQTELDRARLLVNQHEQASLEPRARIAQIPLLLEQCGAEKISLESRRETLRAQKAVTEAALSKARLDFSRTEIHAPADGVFLRSPGAAKVLAKGDLLLAGEDAGLVLLDAHGGVEIPVSLDVADALWVRGVGRGIRVEDMDAITRGIGEVEVSWFQDPRFKWKGRVDRLRADLDATTRTVTLLVHVDLPGTELVVGERIPLSHGMYCRVEIPGYEHARAIVVPRHALHPDRRVHLMKDGVLEVREVDPVRTVGDLVVLESGLEEGELLVLTDLPAAVPGMRLEAER